MDLENINYELDEIINDRTVPKNIRESIRQIKAHLNEESQEFGVRRDRAIQIFDEVCNDSNLPMYTRTQIWNIISMLEEE